MLTDLENRMIFAVLSFAIATLIFSVSSNSFFKQTFVFTFAQENEAEVETDIEQENKCKKVTECENENELNNQLSVTNLTTAGQQEESSTLNVTKKVTCSTSALYPEFCENLGPEDILITVTGNNPNPDEFPGSSDGTLVTLGAGDYTVSESFNISPGIGSFGVSATFSEDCTQTGEFEGQGTIAEGEAQTCTIDNFIYWIAPL